MLPKRLSELTKADVERLVTDQVPEGRTLDYKRDAPTAKEDDKRELARDVAGLANTDGGDLVYGIEEAKDADGKNLGYAGSAPGVECANFEQVRQRLEQSIRDNIDPRVQGVELREVPGFPRGPVIVVRVPRSWQGPHMVTFQGTHFFSRNGFGRHPLDVREIRMAFLQSADVIERIRTFRAERIRLILAGTTPIPVEKERGKIVLHIVPLAPSGSGFDFAKYTRDAATKMPPPYASGWSDRFNLEGHVTYVPQKTQQTYSYSQIFRDGSCEQLLARGIPVSKNGSSVLSGFFIEKTVAKALTHYLQFVRLHGVECPIVVMLTIFDAKGASLLTDTDAWGLNAQTNVIDRDVLPLPDMTLENPTNDVQAALRPLFDMLWQSCGWERSFGYDDKGVWLDEKHPS